MAKYAIGDQVYVPVFRDSFFIEKINPTGYLRIKETVYQGIAPNGKVRYFGETEISTVRREND